MTRVSIELVPRSSESLEADLATVRARLPSVTTINVPDLLRFDLRSWDACALARRHFERAIPHVRAMDFTPKQAPALLERLEQRDLTEVLVVRGDPPQDMSHRVHPTTSAELIQSLKTLAPGLRVFAAFDPYRGGLRNELDGVREKLAAGADGFFSQPMFDLRLMEICAEQLAGHDVYWGISPVVRTGSRRYWEVKNRAFFPADFEPTLAWNRSFAARCIDWARAGDHDLYFMPIRLDVAEYLEGLL
jgi:methylenetetrahydrofolate reductase (NADPH)